MKRKILSLLLALCLLVPAAPVHAASDGSGLKYELRDGGAVLVAVPAGTSGDLVLPAALGGAPVTAVGDGAFRGCTGLTGVRLPATVTAVGADAFRDCTALRSVLLPPAVASIGEGAFRNCPKSLVIFGARGSYAETFAAEHGMTFLTDGLPFTDVPAGAWFYPYVYGVYNARLMAGVTETRFAPGLPVTRGMFVTVLHRLAHRPAADGAFPFTDVADGRYYTEAVRWACGAGIAAGMGGGVFAPEAAVTREQAVAFLSRFCSAVCGLAPEGSAGLGAYADGAAVQPYARAAFAWAAENGILSGYPAADGAALPTLRPQSGCTRAEAATLLVRLVRYLSDEGIEL